MQALFIDPGRLRTELSLQASELTADGFGGFSEGWSETALVFAQVEPVSAASVFGADQTLETVTHRVTLRFRSGVASGMRFVKAGRVFEIVTVHDPDETGRYLVCRTREVGPVKFSMQLTMDGLIRALRLREHGLVEEAAEKRRRPPPGSDAAAELRKPRKREIADELARR